MAVREVRPPEHHRATHLPARCANEDARGGRRGGGDPRRDAALEPEDVAEAVWQATQDGRFLILPHPEVADYHIVRATDTDKRLCSMHKLQAKLDAHLLAPG